MQAQQSSVNLCVCVHCMHNGIRFSGSRVILTCKTTEFVVLRKAYIAVQRSNKACFY